MATERITTGMLNIPGGIASLQSRITALRNKMQSNLNVTSDDFRELAAIHNVWMSHEHLFYDKAGTPLWRTTTSNVGPDPTANVILVGHDIDEMQKFSVAGETWTNFGVDSGLGVLNSAAATGLDITNCAVVSSGLALYKVNVESFPWTSVGSGLAISGMTGGTKVKLAALTSDSVAFVDNSNNELRTYQFDGSTWSQIGSGLSVGATALTALNSTDVAVVNGINLQTYRFNGSTWGQVGSGLNMAAVTLTTLNSTDVAVAVSTALWTYELRTYRFNGSTWSQVGTGTVIGGDDVAIVGLGSNRVAWQGVGNPIQVAKFNEFGWSDDYSTGINYASGGEKITMISLTDIMPGGEITAREVNDLIAAINSARSHYHTGWDQTT